ncbi:Neuronal growth regulator 1 [Liparis tanakae]|uniref:Neuronal growth regulator 1 n=1 Tax=Liparis tanakae TaxID=230148 RepID=A0A4Z2G166_9TELE|nr:Neuronal growth regulator 1 [Liparis tanakae]
MEGRGKEGRRQGDRVMRRRRTEGFEVPANIYKVSEDITVNEGSNMTLSCLASGRPDPAINWRLLNPSEFSSNA